MSSSASVVSGEPKKGLAIASLVVGILSILTLGCLGVGALTGLVLGIVALRRATGSPQQYSGKGLAIGGIVTSGLSLLLLIPFFGIVAAIAIPSFLRARISANEASAMGDVRTVISAEAAYQSQNGAYYGSLECLSAPAGCIPGYTGPAFLLGPPLAGDKAGYRRTFHPGPAVQPGEDEVGRVSPSSLQGFAFTAVPLQPGTTGTRSFCGDATGVVCSVNGATVEVVDGACGSSCIPQQ
ncbi:MAG: DUF4190 domain-containing protein [Vicinamibacteria bacterium]|jgi:type II secretory pathway pseudopilin PulG|nr:DUF4190 domain-containing protein [Vicinamibacteria bacterium]